MFNSFLAPSGSYTPTLELGDTYGGGTIVYLLQPGDPGYDYYNQHGLIFGEFADQGIYPNTLWAWGNAPQYNVTTSSALGAGAANTAAIVAAYGTSAINYAAYGCYNSTYNGYTDWYLPSIGDLQAMIPFAKDLPSWLANIRAAWTSTQLNINDAYEIYNNQTNTSTTQKTVNSLATLTRSF
jgi:hypothetical protein